MLVSDIIRLNGRHRRDDEALVVGRRRLTYGDLAVEVEAVTAALAGAGIGKGDRIGVLGKNTLEYFLLYFASARRGAILVPLNFWHRPAEHEYTVGNAEPSLLFVERELEASLGAAGPGVRRVILPVEADAGDWPAFMADAAPLPVDDPEISPDDPHMILYTSGTTGRPKGAVLSHRRTIDDAISMAAALRVRSDDTFVNYFPPFHVGNWDHMKLFLLIGARVILMRQFDAGAVLRVIPTERVTVVLGVPTMLHDLLDHPEFVGTDTSSIRLVYYGAYDPSGVMRRTAEAFGADVGRAEMAHTYGLTECGPFVTLCEPKDLFSHWGSIGRPVPGVDVELQDDDGTPVAEGEAGEICVRGPMMTGYWKNPEASAEALRGGWLHTGDVAITDKDGFYFIVDRKKDMIRSGGQNVYSKEIEDTLQMHPAVAEAGVIGVPDPRFEEAVCAIVVLRPGFAAGDAMAAELTAHVRASLAGYNTPRLIEFVPDLPRNAVGKIQKHLLREQYGSMFDASSHGSTRSS